MRTNQQGYQVPIPMNTLSQIPAASPGAAHITALVKESGRVTGYQLSDGRILSKADAISLARQGGIQGVGIATRSGNEYLKSLPDGDQGNNLGNLPSITQ